MAIELDATVGGAAANSYCTNAAALAYAELYFSSADCAAWKALPADDRARYLIQATRQMELYLAWEGDRVDDVQTLSWPRTGVWDREGFEIPLNAIPQQVMDAEVETALWLYQTALKGAEDTAAQLSLVKVGPITVDINQSSLGPAKKYFPDRVFALLNGFAIFDAGETPSGGVRTVRLVRG